MTIALAVGLLGYALLIAAAALVDVKLGTAVAGLICLYIAFANQRNDPQ